MRHFKYFTIIIITITLLFTSCSQSNNGRSELRLGNKKYESGLFNESESNYLKSIYQSESLEAFYGLGNSLQRQLTYSIQEKQDTIDSIANNAYNEGIELSTLNKLKLSKLYHNQGNLFYLKGLRYKNLQNLDESNRHFHQSAECYKSSLRLNPSDNETRYNLAMALYMLQQNKNEQEKNQDQNQNDKQDQNKEQDQNQNENQDQNKEQNQNQNENQDQNQSSSNKEDQRHNDNQDNNNNNEANKQQPQNNPLNNYSPRSQGEIDERTANQLLNAAQQDENRVQKKIEKASAGYYSNEKDW